MEREPVAEIDTVSLQVASDDASPAARELQSVPFPLVRNLSALRGLDTIASAGLAAAIGDPSRFATAPAFMTYLGLAPSEHSTGSKRRTGAITKAGDIHARTLLIEAAHSYRLPARVARHKLDDVDTVPETVREIA